jgi:hypothetical protein
MLPQLLEFIRSLSFGALAVNAILLLVYYCYPHFFPADFSYKEILAIGTLVGTAAHRVLNAAAFNPFTHAMYRSIGFYGKLYELGLLRVRGIVSEEEYLKISTRMKHDYFGVPLMEPASVSSQRSLAGDVSQRDTDNSAAPRKKPYRKKNSE